MAPLFVGYLLLYFLMTGVLIAVDYIGLWAFARTKRPALRIARQLITISATLYAVTLACLFALALFNLPLPRSAQWFFMTACFFNFFVLITTCAGGCYLIAAALEAAGRKISGPCPPDTVPEELLTENSDTPPDARA